MDAIRLRTSHAFVRLRHAPFGALLGAWAAFGCSGAAVGDDVDEARSPLISGTQTAVRPEIGQIAGKCTGTLIHPRFIVTAGTCLGSSSGPVNESFDMYSSPTAVTDSRIVHYAYTLGTTDASNIAFGRLSTPSIVAPATIATTLPVQGQSVSAFGYGCELRQGGFELGGGFKTYRNYAFGTSTSFACSMDHGGPRVSGPYDALGAAIWGVTGQPSATGPDKVADLVLYAQPHARAIAAMGGTTYTKTPLADFALWALAPEARLVSGDFNGDGAGDIALLRYPRSNTIAVAFGNGGGSFNYTDFVHPDFPIWAKSARSIVSGDFDGDGDADIALTGGSGWNTVPVAYSNRDGTFAIANEPAGDFAAWAQSGRAVAADLSGDGVTDIALVGGSGWNTVPIQKRKPGGVREVVNLQAPTFAAQAQASSARAYAGTFAPGSAQSLILVGSTATTTPLIALSNGGTWIEQSVTLEQGNTRALGIGSKVLVGDFNDDGRSDIAVIGDRTSDANVLPVELSTVSGGILTYKPSLLPAPDFPSWATNAIWAFALRRVGSSGSDIALAGLLAGPTNAIPMALVRR